MSDLSDYMRSQGRWRRQNPPPTRAEVLASYTDEALIGELVKRGVVSETTVEPAAANPLAGSGVWVVRSFGHSRWQSTGGKP